MESVIHVVAGIWVNADKKILLAKRAPHKSMAGKWEFPGGKVRDETPVLALTREMSEEFGVYCSVGDHFFTTTHLYPEFAISLATYWVTSSKYPTSSTDHDELQWVDHTELLKFDLSEADVPVAELLVGCSLSEMP